MIPKHLSTRRLATAAALLLAACSDGGGGPTGSQSTVPAAPQNAAATALDAQATVTWAAPASDGGSSILRYRVTAVPGGASATVDAPATSATVAGLANGTAYTFTVAAVNAVGEGPASAPTAPVTPREVPQPGTGEPARWVSGYYVGYQRDLYPPDQVDVSLMTHLVVGRIRPASNGDVIANFDIDDVNGPAMARTLSARAHAANRKAILMLGGAGEHGGFVGAASSATRARFVANLLRVMDELGYDGLDVDWEPIEAADRAPLLALLRDLRTARPGIILTIPVGWVNNNFRAEADAWYAQLAAAVDQVNLMTYDMAGNWGGWQSWHHSALYDEAPNRPSSVSSSIQAYLDAGVPAARLGIGIGFYGSCWRGVTEPRIALDGRPGVSQGNSDNAMSYTNILARYMTPGARRWDAAARVPYLSFATGAGPQNCNFVSYEDEESIAHKGQYVRDRGLGGTIIWTIGQGRVPTAPAGSRDPLLKAVYQAFLAN